MPQIVWMSMPDGSANYYNQKWIDYTGLSPEESFSDAWDKTLHPDDRQLVSAAWQEATAARSIYSAEMRLRRADGVYRWWLVRGVPQLDGAGQITQWFGTSTDIHDLKMAEIKITRLNRVHAVSSGINALIVRATDRHALVSEACKIAVEEGGFRLSVMCLVDQNTMKIRVVASAGKDDELSAFVKNILSSAGEGQHTLIAQALGQKNALVIDDSEHDLRVCPRTSFGVA
jgi:PAS domain S-box-containing protein